MLAGPGTPVTDRKVPESSHDAIAWRQASPGVRSGFWAVTARVRSSAPRTIPSSIRQLEARQGVEQVVGIADRPAAGRDDEIAGLEPGRVGRRCPPRRPRTRMPSRSGSPTDRRSRRATWFGAMATPSRRRSARLAATQRVDPRAERGIGRKREVEALRRSGSCSGRESARAVDERPRPTSPGAIGAVCSTLPAIRRPPGPRKERDTEDTSPNVTRAPPPNVAATPNTGVADREAVAGAPRDARRAGRVDLHDRQVAVRVDAGHGAARRATVGERDGDFATAQVVGVGQDLAVGDDHARPAPVAADADDRSADALLGDADDRRPISSMTLMG